MAARDRLGGLAEATRASVVVLGHVFDVVLVETVGVGQSESDVAELVDTLAFVTQPGAGDLLQFMKAGVLELPDVFVVNKSDLGPTARRTAHELESTLALGEAPDRGWSAPVILASARDGAGIEALVAALDAHRAHLLATGALRERRERGREASVLESLERRYGSYGLAQLGGREAVRARLRERRDASSFALQAELGREIEDALRKPA
jgi:LAO/AO transport system kinase